MQGKYLLIRIYLDRINILETTKKFKRDKSKKLLKRIHRKAFKIASNRLKVKNLISQKTSSVPKIPKVGKYEVIYPDIYILYFVQIILGD